MPKQRSRRFTIIQKITAVSLQVADEVPVSDICDQFKFEDPALHVLRVAAPSLRAGILRQRDPDCFPPAVPRFASLTDVRAKGDDRAGDGVGIQGIERGKEL